MKLEQFQSMVRIEYTEGEEATAVVRLPVLAASDVLLTGGLNVYWASPVLALPEPLKYIYKGMPAKVDPKPTEQPTNPAGEQPDPKAAVTIEDNSGKRARNNFGWTGIARTLFEHIATERKKQGLPALTPATVETIQPIGVVEVDLVALLKSMRFPSGTYCFRRATPMDKLLVQPAPNRVLKQEHLNLLYHQLLYIQQELCEVKFIRAEVVRDGTYNGGVLEDPKVTPDPEQPNTGDTGSTEPKPKPQPEPDVDTETQAVPMSEHLTTIGYTIAYIHNGVPVIFGKAPFKLNKRGQQIDSNGYLTLSQTDTQLRVLNKATAFTTYEAAVGTRPEASVLNAAGYTKDSSGKYYAVLPRIQTTVLPSNSPNGRFEEVYKDANGYSIEYAAEADTGNYKWFVRLADPKEKAEEHTTETQPTPPKPSEDSGSTGTVTPSEPERSTEHSTAPAPATPAPAQPEPERHDHAPTTPEVSSDPADHGAVIKEYHVASAPTVNYHKEDHVPTYLGYSRDSYGNYPALGTITKWIVAKDSPESARGTPPMYLDEHNSVVEWTEKEGTEPPEGYWTLKLDETPTSADAHGSAATEARAPEPAKPTRVTDQNAVVEKVPNSGQDTGYSRESYSVEQMRITGYEPNKYGRYDAIAPITKWVAGANTPEWLKNILPQYSDAKNSEVEWVVQTDPDNPSQRGYWAVSKVRVKR